MMEHVYRGAQKTLLWLGADSDNGSAFRAIMKWFPQDFFSGSESGKQYILPRDRGDLFNVDKWSMKEKAACRRLLKAPYFERHWIAQEIVLSKHRVIQYGDDVLPWETLMSAARNAYLSSISPNDASQLAPHSVAWFLSYVLEGQTPYEIFREAMRHSSRTICDK